MKKKILSFILVAIFILPVIFVFSSCKDAKETRTLTEFNVHFNEVLNKTDGITGQDLTGEVGANEKNLKSLQFVYSENLIQILATSEGGTTFKKYYFLNHFYNRMLDSALSFLYAYTPTCLTSEKNIDEIYIANLYQNLDLFVKNLKQTISAKETLEDSINMDLSHADSGVCIAKLSALYLSYEKTIQSACDLSFAMSKIYFEKIAIDSENSLLTANFNEEVVRLRAADYVKAKYFYYKLLYTQIFFKVNVENADLSTKIKRGEYLTENDLSTLSAYEPFNYVSTLGIKIISEADTNSLQANAADLKSYIMALFNAQFNIDKQIGYFNTATNKISYYSLKTAENKTDEQYAFVNYIDLFLQEVYNGSYSILKELLSICFA